MILTGILREDYLLLIGNLTASRENFATRQNSINKFLRRPMGVRE